MKGLLETEGNNFKILDMRVRRWRANTLTLNEYVLSIVVFFIFSLIILSAKTPKKKQWLFSPHVRLCFSPFSKSLAPHRKKKQDGQALIKSLQVSNWHKW